MARPKTGSNLSITQLESMLNTRLAEVQHLHKQHARLSHELLQIERKITALGGKAGGRKGIGTRFASGRVRNEKSLVEMLNQVLSASIEPMRVGDIVDAVLKGGYQTSSDNFRGIVNQTLIKERRRFVSAGRGLYSVKAKK